MAKATTTTTAGWGRGHVGGRGGVSAATEWGRCLGGRHDARSLPSSSPPPPLSSVVLRGDGHHDDDDDDGDGDIGEGGTRTTGLLHERMATGGEARRDDEDEVDVGEGVTRYYRITFRGVVSLLSDIDYARDRRVRRRLPPPPPRPRRERAFWQR